MTQQDKVEKLAIQLMGWNYSRLDAAYYKDGKMVQGIPWNPFRSEDDARQVIEKLMEDLDLFARYCDEILDEDTDQRGAMQCAFQATLTERMDAVVSILPEKK